MSRRYHCYSRPGRGKTKFALSGKGRTWYGEFDVGSYDRAKQGAKIDETRVEKHEYHPPVDLRNRGHISTAMAGAALKGPVFVARRIEGYSELFERFADDFMTAVQGDYSTFVLDTESVLYEVVRNDYLQRIQDEVTETREKLQRAEYEETRKTMASILNLPKMYDKDIVFVSHMKELWEGGQATGRFGPDGWNKVDDYSDCTLEFDIDNKTVFATVRKGPVALTGMRVDNPTLESVSELLSAASKLADAGKPIPGTAMDVILEAAKLG